MMSFPQLGGGVQAIRAVYSLQCSALQRWEREHSSMLGACQRAESSSQTPTCQIHEIIEPKAFDEWDRYQGVLFSVSQGK